LLGDIGVANTKNKKKNNDFFNDLDLWYFYCYFLYFPLFSNFIFNKNLVKKISFRKAGKLLNN
jgi:hypothetical protein